MHALLHLAPEEGTPWQRRHRKLKLARLVGGLNNSATGQVLGSVGYNWTPSIATTLGYRVLHTYERDISGPLRDFRYQSWMYGPFAGFKYGF
jgi:hypothetical protein